MLIYWALAGVGVLLSGAANLLPNWGLDPTGGLSTALQNISALNYFLPISEVFTAVLAGFSVVPVLFGINMSLWVVAFLRGGSSRG